MLCERIRQDLKPKLPIIVLTADDKTESVIRALRLGVNNYITNPLLLKICSIMCVQP
jgi:DNA-binding response OmpR family regulator